jgi:hypothetical protein
VVYVRCSAGCVWAPSNLPVQAAHGGPAAHGILRAHNSSEALLYRTARLSLNTKQRTSSHKRLAERGQPTFGQLRTQGTQRYDAMAYSHLHIKHSNG